VYRRTGIIVLLIAAALTVWFSWLPLRHFTGYTIGTGGLERAHVPCGSTIGILTDHFDPAVKAPGAQHDCKIEARGRLFFIVAIDVPLLLIGGFVFARCRHPSLPLHGSDD
jgi:hypothetical protein